MLHSIRIQNYKCFQDTDRVPLGGLNILVGANNSGKSTFLSVVELLSRYDSPTKINPVTASFDSSVRQRWSPKEKKPDVFEFEATFPTVLAGKNYSVSSKYARDQDDGSAFIRETVHGHDRHLSVGPRVIHLRSIKPGSSLAGYNVLRRPGSNASRRRQEVLFHDLLEQRSLRFGIGSADLISVLGLLRHFPEVLEPKLSQCIVVRPSRLVPRPLYVLDDPTLDEFDRDVISELRAAWLLPEGASIRARIQDHLRTLGLAKSVEARMGSLRGGRTRTVEVRVATHRSRAQSSLADVGFGVSQVLPLLVADARLESGVLIAYQPEVHLHPFAQSRLADLFAASVMRGNQVFVETHSEHLILRLQVLVAEGRIGRDQISLFFFENQTGDARIRRVTLGSRAEPVGKWPSGFFDVGVDLARLLSAARLKATK